jgi:hypothetical protein
VKAQKQTTPILYYHKPKQAKSLGLQKQGTRQSNKQHNQNILLLSYLKPKQQKANKAIPTNLQKHQRRVNTYRLFFPLTTPEKRNITKELL